MAGAQIDQGSLFRRDDMFEDMDEGCDPVDGDLVARHGNGQPIDPDRPAMDCPCALSAPAHAMLLPHLAVPTDAASPAPEREEPS